jgi:hypothetical protein
MDGHVTGMEEIITYKGLSKWNLLENGYLEIKRC